ncbi:WD repeat-containing protein 13-like isoform X1 [Dermatophagoides pteronyssinus]|uniref:WD repeat-containing protein 13-like isoform X1 n=2 Tax=Dermatophagoides pteronyssinus TaxID=6956 RepID=UPI003F673183
MTSPSSTAASTATLSTNPKSMTTESSLESSIFWQHIIAMDVQYNSSRYFCTYMKILYIKRRNQLFRELSKQPLNSFRKQYLRLRHTILSNFYQQQQQQQKKHVRNNSDSSFLSFIYDDLRSYSGGDWKSNITMTNDLLLHNKDVNIDNLQFQSLNVNDDNNHNNNNNNNNNNIAFCENFAFTGVHHIFDQHKSAVNCVKFANSNNSLICFASDDHTLSICQLTPLPATILFILRGHQDSVTAFEWSQSNELIVSCSCDSTLNLWSTMNGKCLRRFKDPQKCSILTCIFLPTNNNMIFTGNQNGIVNILNLSTGIYSKNSVTISDGGPILSMCFESKDQLLWCGDSKGFISTFHFEMETCKLLLINKVIIVPGCPITSLSLSSSTILDNDNNQNLLLANCACNAVVLFRTGIDKKLEFLKCFPIKHQNSQMKIKSSFCPNSNRSGNDDNLFINNQSSTTTKMTRICLVTGSEDTCIYFYHYQSPNLNTNTLAISRCVNKLQGHSAPVLDVRFNHDESLLASADSKGSIIIWKRDSSITKKF